MANRGKKLFCGVMMLFVLLQICAASAFATHFRYGHLTWERRTDIDPNAVSFVLTSAFRRDGYPGTASDGYPQTGDVILETIGGTKFNFGDGNLTNILRFEVTSYDVDENWIIAIAEEDGSSYDKEIIHTYPKSGIYTANIDSCCRLEFSEGHINNPEGRYRLETDVDLGSANAPPVSSLSPIVTVEQNSSVSFNIPANDVDGDILSWRLSTSTEASGTAGVFTQPNGLTIDSATGDCLWSTSGLTLGYYSCQITIEDGKTSVPVDFFINVVEQTTNITPKFDVPPTPADKTVYSVTPGEEITFTVQASDTDAGDLVSLNHAGLPNGANFEIPAPENPVSSVFSWTPTENDIGVSVVNFKATDKNGLSATISINFTVNATEMVGSIGGTVKDSSTGLPIKDATVSIGSTYSATTDVNGSYILYSVKAGDYTATASAAGYKSASADVTVSAYSVTSQDFELVSLTPATPVPSPTKTSIPIPTPTPATTTGDYIIFGAVLDEYKDPFQGVDVTLSGGGITQETETDADGDYSFHDLPAADYTLTFKAKGYVTKTADVSREDLEDEEVYEVETIRMEPEGEGLGKIFGYAYDIYAEPIEDVKVTIKGITTGSKQKEYTDKDGFFEFTELEPDTYTLTTKKKHYKKAKKTVTLDEEGEKYVELELRKSKKSRLIIAPEEVVAE